MEKTIYQLFISLLLFFGIWFGLSHIDYLTIFGVKEKTSQMEEALGKFYMDIINRTETQITDEEVLEQINEIKNRICLKNDIDTASFQVHVIKQSEVNAFAMPKNIVIYSELISFCNNPEELAGIMAHEIAHLEKNHIMKKLSKEIGFTALSAMISNGSGGMESLKVLSSTAYDRKMEEEADETAVEYLLNSDINAEPMADFMFRLSTTESSLQKNLTFISTHPETEKRAQKILDLSKNETEPTPLFSEDEWKQLQEKVQAIPFY